MKQSEAKEVKDESKKLSKLKGKMDKVYLRKA
jgi:hypothetical protein